MSVRKLYVQPLRDMFRDADLFRYAFPIASSEIDNLTCHFSPLVITQQTIVNPKPFLAGLTGKEVIVKLKWGMEYKGMSDGSSLYGCHQSCVK